MGATTMTDAAVFSSRLLEVGQAGQIVLSLPGSDYQLHLETESPVKGEVGKRIRGRIMARARRIDVAADGRGGAYIEPVIGRPRRLQGRVIASDPVANTITVQCAAPFVCTLLDPLQKAADILPGTFDGSRYFKQ